MEEGRKEWWKKGKLKRGRKRMKKKEREKC